MEQDYFKDIMLRPHWMQYCLCKLPEILACMAVCVIAPFIDSQLMKILVVAIGIIVFVCLVYSIIDMYRIRYIITGEQILYKHGVFSYTTDYIEMYRIYDYQQTRTPLQQITGLKTVTILANDRLNPALDIIGQENDRDVVAIIRHRVEYNKQMKNVYEIANRY